VLTTNSVELFGVIVHLAKINQLASFGVAFSGFVQTVLIHVAQDDDVFRFDAFQISGSATARADDRQIEFVVQVSTSNDGRSG
jgi:hypothetical protein